MTLLRSSRLWLNAAGLGTALALFAISFFEASPWRDLTVGVATSFLFLAVLNVLAAGELLLLGHGRRHFFGAELTNGPTNLVYPDFVIHNDIRILLAKFNQQMLFQRPESKFGSLTVHRIDIPRTVALNDIQALLYISDALPSTLRSPNVLMVNNAVVEDPDRSFVSFGFSSNDCTHLYLNEAQNPLFEIVEDGEGSEFVRLSDGHEFISTNRRQYGLIVRYCPDIRAHPERRWFLVAGLGPVGTPAAAWYLAHSWQELAQHTHRTTSFVAVISTGAYTSRVPRLEHLLKDQGEGRTT